MDARIPLGFRAPEAEIYTPLDAQRKQIALQSLGQQNKLNEMRIAEQEEQARQLAEDREDEAYIQKAFVEQGGDHDKVRAAIAPKVRMRSLQRWDTDHLKQQQAATALANEQRVQLATNNTLIGSAAASLLEIPYAQRRSVLPTTLERLQKAGVDTSQIPADFDPNDDDLRRVIVGSNYMGQVLSYADKRALEEQRRAAAQKAEQATKDAELKNAQDLKQRLREEAARTHLTVTTPEQHKQWLANLPDSIAGEFANLKEFSPVARRAVQQMALTAQQRTTDEDRDASQQARTERDLDRARYERDQLDLRKAIADQQAALRDAALEIQKLRLTSGGGGRSLTGNALKVEERNIASIENGTATKAGLHAKRMQLGRMLKSNVNEKGEELNENGRLRLETELQAVDDNLQQLQYRKARLYQIGAPDPTEVSAAKEGQEIEAEDGSIWKKQGGVAFFVRRMGQAEAAPPAPGAPGATPARAPAAAPGKPATPTATPPPRREIAKNAATHQRAAGPSGVQKMTEAEARKKALDAGKGEEGAKLFIQKLREANLLK